MDNISEIFLAGGCFWGVEAYFSRLLGVINTQVGYANGNIDNPNYELVCKGESNFVETVKVIYNTQIISLENILDNFFEIIDPTTLNRQAYDSGTQYRSGVYYTDEKAKDIINSKLEEIKTKYSSPIVTEVIPLSNFYTAEDYHQKYLEKNPNGYCHINLSKFTK